ncbi:MAG: phospholipase D-like domain-containing protein [Pseudobdellovibrionaceae bacterium]
MKYLLVSFVVLFSVSSVFARKHKSNSVIKELFDEVSIQAPVENEVCFSPDEHCDVKLYKFIQSAKTSIDVAIFDVTLDKFVHELLVAAQKIPVRIIVDKRQAEGKRSLVSTLIKAGANVRYGKQRGIMHDKFTILDGKMLETGSFNYTNHASAANQENQIYLSTPSVVERYKVRFERMWKEAEK